MDGPAERRRLAAAALVTRVDPRSDDARRALERYFDELDTRFPAGFDRAAVDAADVGALAAPDGAFVLVHDTAGTLGCGGLQRLEADVAEIKRMWIHPDWRGLGLGRRVLASLERIAREVGYRRVVLDTNETLLEAIAMYERAGYGPVPRYNDNPYAHHWFGKDV